MFPVRRWPAQDASHEVEVRRLVAQALVQREAPDTRTGALIALVHAVGCVDKVVDPRHYGLSRRELRARAKEIAEGNWASEAVRTTIEEMMAAIIAATIAATAGVQAWPGIASRARAGRLDRAMVGHRLWQAAVSAWAAGGRDVRFEVDDRCAESGCQPLWTVSVPIGCP